MFAGKLKDMPGAMELLEKMLVLDPKKRVTAHEAFFAVRSVSMVGLNQVAPLARWLLEKMLDSTTSGTPRTTPLW